MKPICQTCAPCACGRRGRCGECCCVARAHDIGRLCDLCGHQPVMALDPGVES